MANEVFANGREISCKSGAARVIASFPDVCFTPPQTAATPLGVPIPYPVTSRSSDTTKGSKTVKINRKEVMLRNRSFYKRCTGDEAGNAPKKGIITSSRTSKTYFRAWSMDVKIENKNVVRHLDITTSNHRSEGPNAAIPNINTEGAATPTFENCNDYESHHDEACKDSTQRTRPARDKHGNIKHDASGNEIPKPDGLDCDDKCREAKACILKPKKEDKTFCCHPSTTGHHLVEVHGFCKRGERGKPLEQFPSYKMNDAPCVCAEGSRHNQEHGDLHAVQGVKENFAIIDAPNRNPARDPDYAWTYGEARQAGLEAHQETFKNNDLKCNPDCLANTLDHYHSQHLSNGDDTPLRTEMNRLGDQASRGTELIRERAERVIGEISGAPFPLR